VTPKPTSWQTKAVYHGLSQGFIGWLRNKDFWSGFVAGVVGHGVGHSLDASGISSMYARAAIASGAAAITAGATGGDAAAAALSAVIVHLYNAENISGRKANREAREMLVRSRQGPFTQREARVVGGTNGLIEDFFGSLFGGKATQSVSKAVGAESISSIMSELGSKLDFDEVIIESVTYDAIFTERGTPKLSYYEKGGIVFQFRYTDWILDENPRLITEVNREPITRYRN
jgi:hypothetical protein